LLRVRNLYDFIDLSGVSIHWKLEDGERIVRQGSLYGIEVAPQEETMVKLPILLLEGLDFHHRFDLSLGVQVGIARNGVEMLTAPASFTVWRAPTDNDRNVKIQWLDEGYDRTAMKVYACVSSRLGR
jgi:hypothetical protein